jgi:very-short-patch-repair endonuclease
VNADSGPSEAVRELRHGDDDPAIVWCHVTDADAAHIDDVESLLAQLEQAAIALFPRWLPDAALFDGPQGGAIAAVRVVAARTAAVSDHYGPYLADLAERALRCQCSPADGRRETGTGTGTAAASRTVPRGSRFSPATRAAELARIVATAHHRPSAAMVIEVPGGLSRHAKQELTAAAEWIAYHGAWRVGLAMTGRTESQREAPGDEKRSVPLVLGAEAQAPRRAESETAEPETVESETAESGTVEPETSCPDFDHEIVQGRPRPDSPAELALETALRARPWATGRSWNRTYQSTPLAPVYRLDLWWPAERCVVEIDGSEHRSAEHYAADRRRDVQLQLDGQCVLRFTNDDVLTDVTAVVARIERFLRSRRS